MSFDRVSAGRARFRATNSAAGLCSPRRHLFLYQKRYVASSAACRPGSWDHRARSPYERRSSFDWRASPETATNGVDKLNNRPLLATSSRHAICLFFIFPTYDPSSDDLSINRDRFIARGFESRGRMWRRIKYSRRTSTWE